MWERNDLIWKCLCLQFFFCIIFGLCRIYVLFFVLYNLNFDDVCDLHNVQSHHIRMFKITLHSCVLIYGSNIVSLSAILFACAKFYKVIVLWEKKTERYNGISISWSVNCNEFITRKIVLYAPIRPFCFHKWNYRFLIWNTHSIDTISNFLAIIPLRFIASLRLLYLIQSEVLLVLLAVDTNTVRGSFILCVLAAFCIVPVRGHPSFLSWLAVYFDVHRQCHLLNLLFEFCFSRILVGFSFYVPFDWTMCWFSWHH